jgi:primosomal protein N' (replication factor Y)
MFVKIVFFLPMRNAFTYAVPEHLRDVARFGVRAVAPFGKRTLTGVIVETLEENDTKHEAKEIYDVIDKRPIINRTQLEFYKWLSDYYVCSLGEALRLTVPHGTEIETKRKIISSPEVCADLLDKLKKKNSVKGKLLAELAKKENHTLKSLQKAVRRKNIYSQLHALEKEGAITVLDVVEKPAVKIKTQKFVKLTADENETYARAAELERRSPKQALLLIFLANYGGEIALSELQKKTKAAATSIKSLEEKGYVEIYDKEIERVYEDAYDEQKRKLIPNEEQAAVIEKLTDYIERDEFKTFLLHGVTGSGKTQVYIELADEAIKRNKTALILVPEISLTPQITARFFNRFADKVAVFHSKMSKGERYDVWRGVLGGKYKIVIGPRSALFTPLSDVGIIIVDEEHDPSYKQYDMTPRYNARDAAVMLAMFYNSPALLGSATPSLESMHNAEIGKFELLRLTERADNARMPKIKLVNLNIERKSKRLEGSLSKTLLDAIAARLEKGEGVIILQNRRGFATNVFCEDCGNIEMCPNCSVSLVYHVATNDMRCHYCGFKKSVPKACSVCGSVSLNFFGTGIQKVEDELAFYFPDATISRVDSDTINRRGKLGLVLKEFREGKIDILVGTQMVSKGLDISNVTLVGVVSAEATLWLPDFRADERTFQLLTQVAGRSGRSEKEGEVLIQTENPQHFVLQQVLRNDYETFYNRELELRKKSQYPPFTRLALVEAKSEKEERARGAINDFHKALRKFEKYVLIMPPGEAVLAKLKGEYRYQILIKSFKSVDPSGYALRKAITEAFAEFNARSRFRDVKIIMDIDPVSVL